MVGQGKAKQASSKGLSQGFKEDIISQLPDPLICHILYHLPRKEVVKTSVLSTRWGSLWLWVPSLELNSHDFTDLNAFVSLGHRFFNSDRASLIHKLKLTITIDEHNITMMLLMPLHGLMQLSSVSIYDYASESFIVNNLVSIAKIDISLFFGSGLFNEAKRSNLHSFLLGITRATDMTLCDNTFECMLSSLEYVNFKVGIVGVTAEMKLIRYFIENSAVLKRLTLRLVGDSTRDNYTLKELLRIPRGSTSCEVVIL
ncbi:unnamed protein product [Eruca vesicaria subsp. sativa]|uniref:F-box domain-containing protein n=1 Tax=Eruca vesicaria subsp. sativa TaxID=29727 RepID=A0ABC8JTG3_ERUVS|nr:unnamed protein product [Eruca vesicaria subsp. sativa]